jgi:hypothetical protein
MAIYDKKIIGGNGVNYAKEVDNSSDYSGLTNDTYFKNLSDGLIYYKNTSGDVITPFDGLNLGNSDLTLTDNRTVNLTGSSLTYSDSVGSTSVESSLSLGTGDTLTFSSPLGGAVYSKDDENISYTGGGVGGTFTFNVGRGFADVNVVPSTGSIGGFTLGDDKIGTKGYVTYQVKGIVDDSRLSENNLYYFYVDSGELKGRYKDNLGLVSDLTIGSSSFGLISLKDSSGQLTFYTDLQTAINATSAIDTVYIHSEIQLTATVNIPARTSLTINFQGNRIYGDTTSGDFNLFTITANSAGARRDLYFTGGGVLETIGTVVTSNAAAPFYALNIGTDELKLYAGTTQIRSVNASAFYTNGIHLINGGVFYSENGGASFGGTRVMEYAKIDLSISPSLANMTRNCDLNSRSFGFTVTQNQAITKCNIRGTVTASGNYGLLYVHQGTDCTDNYIEADSSSTKPALYVRGSSGSNGNISNNVVINHGSGIAGHFVYGSGSNNYFYAENNNALNAGANCLRFVNNIGITNSASHQAMNVRGNVIQGNKAINLNATNTLEALLAGDNTQSEIYNNTAEVANAAAYNMKLSGTGTLYVANNVMGLTGLGLDLNGLTNAMVNVPDVYGNLKIG